MSSRSAQIRKLVVVTREFETRRKLAGDMLTEAEMFQAFNVQVAEDAGLPIMLWQAKRPHARRRPASFEKGNKPTRLTPEQRRERVEFLTNAYEVCEHTESSPFDN